MRSNGPLPQVIIHSKMCIPALPEGEGDISVWKGQDTKWLHGTKPSSRTESTKVEHARSRRTNVTVEETGDEDIQRMNVKDKLDASLLYLIDNGKDQGESSRFTLGNTLTPQVRGENKKTTSYNTYEVPVGKWFTHKTPTTDTNDSVPTLHSVHSQYIPLSQRKKYY